MMSADPNKGYSIIPQIETGEMKVDLVRLGPKATKIGITPQTGALFVVIKKSELQLSSEGSRSKRLHGSGVIWLEAGTHRLLANPRTSPSSYFQLSFKNSEADPKL